MRVDHGANRAGNGVLGARVIERREQGNHVHRHVDGAGQAGHLGRGHRAAGVHAIGDHDHRPPGRRSLVESLRGQRDGVVERGRAHAVQAGDAVPDAGRALRERDLEAKGVVEREQPDLVGRRIDPAEHVFDRSASGVELAADTHAAAGIHQDRQAHRALVAGPEAGDVPGTAALEHHEILRLQPAQRAASAVTHHGRQRYQVDAGAERRRFCRGLSVGGRPAGREGGEEDERTKQEGPQHQQGQASP